MIDFFVSHSWRDNAEEKWKKLEEIAVQFKKDNNGRDPMFWFDKLCIDRDQDTYSFDLQFLPYFIQFSQKLLVLCGETYLSRLWYVSSFSSSSLKHVSTASVY